MSRVEEQDEAKRLQAQLDQRKVDAKKVTNNREFQKVAEAGTKRLKASAQQQQGRQKGQQMQASLRQMARDGISNQYAAQLHRDGDSRLTQKRGGDAAADVVQRHKAAAALVANEKAGGKNAGLPVEGRGAKRGRDDAQGRGAQEGPAKQAAQVVAQGAGGPTAPLAQVGGKVGGSGAAGTAKSTQQIIGEIVRKIRKGVIDRTPTFIVEFNEGFGDATFTITRQQSGGIGLAVQSSDKKTVDLMRSGDTAKQLAEHLRGANLNLEFLTVGGHKVIG